MTSTDTQTNTLQSLALKILEWKEKRDWSHAQLAKRFRGLGSDRSLRRAADGEATGDIEKWISRYAAVLSAMSDYDKVQLVASTTLPLGNITPGRSEVTAAIRAADENPARFDRLVIIEGGSGSGKSETLKSIAADLAGAAVLVDCNDTWRSAHAACGDILRAVMATQPGPVVIPKDKNARLNKLLTLLQTRTILLIDEAHHGAGSFLNLLKTILNGTPTVIAIAAIPTIWRKLTTDYTDESLQLQHNRLFARVRIPAATQEDVAAYLAGHVTVSAAEAKSLAELARRKGHFSFLRRIRDKFNAAARDGRAISLEDAVDEAIFDMG